MRILEMDPLSLAEVKEYAGKLEEKKGLETYLKKYKGLDLKKSRELAEEIRALDNLKIKEESIAKIIDFLPKNVEELNKIFKDVSLDEKEANEVLEIVKKY